MKETLVCDASYPYGVGICAVPVLPARRYPGTSACEDSCSSETASMSVNVFAVSGVIGEPAYCDGTLYWWPSRSIEYNTCGVTIRPPLAMDETDINICKGVTV